jgi:hypothetical protein
MSVAIGPQGAISVTLVPNAGGTPDGTYYRVVYKLDDGSTSEEVWSVPATGTTTIAAVRSRIVPSAVAMQVASRQYVDSAIAPAVKLCTASNAQTCIDATSASGGTVYLGAGTYTGAITLPDNGKCVNLVGAGIDLTVLTVSSNTTAVISKGNSSVPLGCRISDLTIDGNLQATYGLQLLKGKGWIIERVKVKRVLAATGEGIALGEASGSNAEFYEARVRGVSIAFESGDYAANARPLNGIHLRTTATDNFVSDVTAWNMTNAGIVDDGGDNQYSKIHVYGYPLLTYYPNYAMEILGGAHITHLTSDGVNLGGVHVRGDANSITNSLFQWPSGGAVSGAFPVVADSGTDYNIYRENSVTNGSGLILNSLAAVFAKIGTDYTPGPNTEIAANLNHNDPTDGPFANWYPQGFNTTGGGAPHGAFTYVTPFVSQPTLTIRVKSQPTPPYTQTADLFHCLSADASTVFCKIDVNGNATFAGVTAPLTGNASTATTLAATPNQCSAGQYATGVTAAGNANCAQVAYSQVSGTPSASNSTPAMDGTGAAGSSANYARGDHVHPSDTSRLAAANNLSDLQSMSTARSNLGLGGAATLNVGTTSGTVAAGDDSRFNCDVTKNPCRVAATALTGQTSSIGSTTLYTCAAGTYRVSLFLYTTVAGSAGTVSASIAYNDGIGGASVGSGTIDLTQTNFNGKKSLLSAFHCGASQAITYTTTVSGATGSPQYGIDVTVERLQ